MPSVDPRTHRFTVDGALPAVLPTESTVQVIWGKDSYVELLDIRPNGMPERLGSVDVGFPLVHGPFGEDGNLQGLLKLAGVTYVGAGVLAATMGMDKQFLKIAFKAAGLVVGPYVMFSPRHWESDAELRIRRTHDLILAVFVKLSLGGSSVGMIRVDTGDNLVATVCLAQRYDPMIVIEQGIAGRGIELANLGGRGAGPLGAPQCGVLVLHNRSEDHKFYDFTSKYTNQAASDPTCPAVLPQAATEETRNQASLVFQALGAEGLARAGFFYTPERRMLINQVNTMLAFTLTSIYPEMWRLCGMTYQELLTELLTLALERPMVLR